MLACPTCGHLLTVDAPMLTSRELDALSAWWITRNVKLAAVLIGVSEQRAKNLLARARQRSRVHSNEDLVVQHLGRLRSKKELVASHNGSKVAAA